jgi:hypothetical protein
MNDDRRTHLKISKYNSEGTDRAGFPVFNCVATPARRGYYQLIFSEEELLTIIVELHLDRFV